MKCQTLIQYFQEKKIIIRDKKFHGIIFHLLVFNATGSVSINGKLHSASFLMMHDASVYQVIHFRLDQTNTRNTLQPLYNTIVGSIP